MGPDLMRSLICTLFLFFPSVAAIAQGFETTAPIAVLMDGESGTVLFEKNAREPIPPASMTKIMTLYMVFERLKSGALTMDDEFTVSDDAWRRGGFRSGSSTMCLNPNERVRVEDLIRGVIVLSGNDAAITLAENISGSEAAFAQAMTTRAHELGLTSVNFLNSTGWPAEGHEISGLDLARLARMSAQDFPEYYAYYGEKEFGWCKAAPSNRFNRNPLLSLFAGADGLKTGHTNAAGYGLVGSAARDGKRRIVVASGLTSNRERSRQSERLLRAAFREFDVKELFVPDAPIGKIDVFLGTQKTVPVGVKQSVQFGVFKPQIKDVKAEIVYSGPVSAPIEQGQKVGALRITSPDKPPVEVDLFALESVTKKGYFSRVVTGLVRFIQGSDRE